MRDATKHKYPIALGLLGAFMGIFASVHPSLAASSPVWVGQWPGGNRGTMQAMAATNGLVYCAIGDGGLAVVNITNTANPTWVGGCNTPGAALDITLLNQLALVADGNAGLQIVDISMPSTSTVVGSFTNCDVMKSVVASGSYAYVADGTNGLQVIDVSIPAAPFRAGGVAVTNGFAEGIAWAGNYAYLACGNAGLLAFDVSNPANPIRKGSFDTAGYARAVTIAGNYAYVADGNRGLRIIDVSNPTNLLQVGTFAAGGYAQGVRVAGSFVYLADSDGGVQILDAGDPTTPMLKAVISTSDWATKVSSSGALALVAAGASLELFDVTNPTNPVPVGNYDSGGHAAGVAISNHRAYVADSLAGLQTFDASNPTNLIRIAQSGDWTFSLTLQDTHALAAQEGAGLRVFDLNSSGVTPLGYYDSTGYAYNIAMMGPYACIADGGQGLQIADGSSPVNPLRVGGYNTSGLSYSVAIQGTTAYVADGATGLQIIDVSNPRNPVRLGAFSTGGRAESVAVRGPFVYVAAYSAGLQVIDATISSNLVRVGWFTNAPNACGITLAGDFAYLSDGSNGFKIFNLANPTNLALVAGSPTGGFAEKVAVGENYLYVADGMAGLMAFQVYGFAGDPPRFLKVPESHTIRAGGSLALDIEVQGEPPINCQWRLNGTNLTGATQTSLWLTNISGNQTGLYSVIVGNSSGSITSSPAMLSLLEAPQLVPAGPSSGTGNKLQFALSTQPQVLYAVEYKTNIVSNWQFLRLVAGDGGAITVTDSTATNNARFYRARTY